MNTQTGQLMDYEKVKQLAPEERAKYVEVKRDLSKLEAAKMEIKKYSPCGCGSGKKFKFCCFTPPRTA